MKANTLTQTAKFISVKSPWKDRICYYWVFRIFNYFAYMAIYLKN